MSLLKSQVLLNATFLEDKIGNISDWKEENRLEISLLKILLLKYLWVLEEPSVHQKS